MAAPARLYNQSEYVLINVQVGRRLHALYESSSLHHDLLTSKIENVCKSLNLEILLVYSQGKTPRALFNLNSSFSRSNNTQLLIKEKSNVT